MATNRLFGSYIVSNTQIGVASLHPYYEYNFTVAAYTVGKGPASNGLVIRTYQDGRSRGKSQEYLGEIKIVRLSALLLSLATYIDPNRVHLAQLK